MLALGMEPGTNWSPVLLLLGKDASPSPIQRRYINDCFVDDATTVKKIAARRLDFLQYEVVAGIPSLTDQVKLTIMNV